MLSNERLQELLELGKAYPRTALIRAAEEAASAERKACAEMIPTTWLDPLLTGPRQALPSTQTYHAADIERLLIALKKRIAADYTEHTG